MTTEMDSLEKKYDSMKSAITARIDEFEKIYKKASEEDILKELVFCLFTPQSKARSCWAAVEELSKKDMILNGRPEDIAETIPSVRFRNNKARYLVEAREMFTTHGHIQIRPRLDRFTDPKDMREWLVLNVLGMGYKEASHFLRNIGLGEDQAILDRHILKNLVLLGVIGDIPSSLSKKKYIKIEEQMGAFAKETAIPLSHLDLLFWCNETGEIFK